MPTNVGSVHVFNMLLQLSFARARAARSVLFFGSTSSGGMDRVPVTAAVGAAVSLQGGSRRSSHQDAERARMARRGQAAAYGVGRHAPASLADAPAAAAERENDDWAGLQSGRLKPPPQPLLFGAPP